MTMNINEYKEKLRKRLDEYMDMPVNAHNIEIISDTVSCLDCLEDYEREMKEYGNGERIGRLTIEDAEEWTHSMRNSDGSRGEHWNYDQTEHVRKQHGYDCDPAEFYAAINMMYSDYYKIGKEFNLNSVDFYAAMAHAFLDDEDAGEDKLAKYYECIVEKH
nr:MAG TPA: hypothetical protein [Caudoviricetes sp.]